MYFNSLPYLIFLGFLWVLYWQVVPKKSVLQNLLLLTAGYVFYTFFDVRFCLILLFISLSDFFLALKIGFSIDVRLRKVLLAGSIFINIGSLIVFRSFNFFIDQGMDFFHSMGLKFDENTVKFVVPVGLSFYTLKSLGYVIDVYKKRYKPEKQWINYLLFVSFFPQLTSGPIDRAKNLLPQINKTRYFDYSVVVSGFRLILFGLFKKMVIADNLSPIVSGIFDGTAQTFDSLTVIFAACLFAVQLYADFSGYTDMAIGTARLFGLFSVSNFRKPYFSLSVSDFWARWHISLSSWFRDYVFLPLAFFFSRKLKKSTYAGIRTEILIYSLSVIPTFLMTGLWHGIGLNYIIWGLFFAVLLIVERLTGKVFRAFRKTVKSSFFRTAFRIFSGFFVFTLVGFNWIFFRSSDTCKAFELINVLFGRIILNDAALGSMLSALKNFWPGMLVFLLLELLPFNQQGEIQIARWNLFLRWTFYFLLLGLILLYGAINLEQGFIYSNF